MGARAIDAAGEAIISASHADDGQFTDTLSRIRDVGAHVEALTPHIGIPTAVALEQAEKIAAALLQARTLHGRRFTPNTPPSNKPSCPALAALRRWATNMVTECPNQT